MSSVLENPSLWRRISPLWNGLDPTLMVTAAVLALAGMVIMYSSGYDHGTRFVDHGRNMVLAGIIMLAVAQVPPQRLMSLALPLYGLGVALLVAVALFGITKKGATRWINVGVVIQP
ncbi:MAG: FtsW/RodA/SpoVE family cell cycle protein, partial [Betaproteobacteria bacterium]